MQLPEETPAERKDSIFTQDDGGFLASDENNINNFTDLYYLGIIDILTPYNAFKKTEHFIKSLSMDPNLISAVKPSKYGDRFISFMKSSVIGYPLNNPLEKSTIARVVETVPKPLTPIVEDSESSKN